MEIYNLLINKDIGTDKGELSADYVRSEISKAHSQGSKEIKLIINSRGGSVYEGFSIYNDLQDAGLKITAYIHGFCGSIATLIASAASYVEMSETAQYMIHNASGGAQGTANEIKSTAEALSQIDTILAQNYAKKTKKTIEDIMSMMDKTTYMTPSQAKEMGFVDAVRMPIAAYGKFNDKIKMDTNFKNKIASAFKAIEEALTGTEPTNFVEPLADGLTILYGEGEFEVGKAVYTDETMTTFAPEGEHALASGKIILVDAAGVIVEIREVEVEIEANQTEILTAQVETLNAEITALKAEKATIETASAAFKAKMDKEFKALKSLVETAETKVVEAAAAKSEVKKSPFDIVAENIKKQY
jgi:ATP-dependent Clp endopeptidase proteolytic subunit ClpP